MVNEAGVAYLAVGSCQGRGGRQPLEEVSHKHQRGLITSNNIINLRDAQRIYLEDISKERPANDGS